MTGKEPATAERKAPAGVRLPTPAQAKQWEELGPGTFARLMSEVEQEEKHRRRMEWAELVREYSARCARLEQWSFWRCLLDTSWIAVRRRKVHRSSSPGRCL
jgi:uncharacterized membrane protein